MGVHDSAARGGQRHGDAEMRYGTSSGGIGCERCAVRAGQPMGGQHERAVQAWSWARAMQVQSQAWGVLAGAPGGLNAKNKTYLIVFTLCLPTYALRGAPSSRLRARVGTGTRARPWARARVIGVGMDAAQVGIVSVTGRSLSVCAAKS